MPKIQLMPYHISARVSRDTQTKYALGHLPGGNDLFVILRDYVNTRKQVPLQDSTSQRVLSVTRTKEGHRSISGLIQTGDYGYEADLIDSTTLARSYRRQVNDAELVPFYFQAYLPPEEHRGILLLQRFGVYGAKTAFCSDFDDFVRAYGLRTADLVLEINPILGPQLADEWLQNGRVMSLTLIQRQLPTDIADYLNSEKISVPELKETQLRLQAKRNTFFGSDWIPRLRNVVSGGSSVQQIIELPRFTPDGAKVEISVSGSTRVVDLVETEKIRAYYDVTNEVSTGPDGHPVFDSIDSVASGVIESLNGARDA